MALRRTLITLSSLFVLQSAPQSGGLASEPHGGLNNVSIAWIEGYACDPQHGKPAVSVELFASAVPGNPSVDYHATRLSRIAVTKAEKPGVSRVSECGENSGFYTATPASLLDRKDHLVAAYMRDASGALQLLNNVKTFNSAVLYRQEPIYNIDEHILVNHAFANSSIAQADYQYFAHNHTLFVAYSRFDALLRAPLSCDLGRATGLTPALLLQTQRGPETRAASCPPIGTPFTGVQADGGRAGLMINSEDFGAYNSGLFLQHLWKEPVAVFRPAHDKDTVRVRGRFRQPIKFSDPAISPDATSFWYYVLYFQSPAGPNMWFTVPVYNSRVLQSSWKRYSDGKTEFTFAEGKDSYANSPLQRSSRWVTPCPHSSLYHQDVSPDERQFCFELSAKQFSMVLQDRAKTDSEVQTEPSKYKLAFFLVNAEAWWSAMAMSARDLTIESVYNE